jgi:putative oxidoreductase
MFYRIVHTNNDWAMTIVRLILGVVFFAHGAQKVLGWFGGYGFQATMGMFTQKLGIPAPFAFLAIGAAFLGGLGLLLGFLSRIAALGIMTNMLVVIFMIHRHIGFFMNWAGNQRGEGFEFHLLVLALGVAIVAKGAGAMSIDRLITPSGPVEERKVLRAA